MYLPLTAWLAEANGKLTTPKLRVTILYETVDAGKRAKHLSDELAAGLSADQALELSLWSFRVLGIRDIRNLAASTAACADLVILSLGGKRSLSAPVQEWIEMWTWLIDGHPPAVVALFSEPGTESARIRAYLRQAAASKKLRFFAPTSGAADCTASDGNRKAAMICSSSEPILSAEVARSGHNL